MSPLVLYKGKLLTKNNKLANSLNCCCDPCDYILCISVIDEDEDRPPGIGGNPDRDQDWATFRAAWPFRPFFLLRPVPSQFGELTLPLGWDGVGPLSVSRMPQPPTDWYNVCGLDNNLPVGGKITLWIDNSGSMTLDTVKTSYNLFLKRLEERVINGVPDKITIANGRLISVVASPPITGTAPGAEDWITPHVPVPGCP
jgi:hypothetical protein